MPLPSSRHGSRALCADPQHDETRRAFDAHTADAERIAWAEERFGNGHAHDALEALLDVAESTADAGLAAHAHSDLAVIALALGDPVACRRAAGEALRRQPERVEALEVLGRCAEADHDWTQAAHWFSRALAVELDDAALWRALGTAEHRRARWSRAADAYRTAAALEPLPADEAECLAAAERAVGEAVDETPTGAPGRVLLCADHPFPSADGAERQTEDVGIGLQALGWSVDVACGALPERTDPVHRGMAVHEVGEDPAQGLRTIVEDGGYNAVLALSDRRAWPILAVLGLPADGPRRVVVPHVHPGDEAHVHDREGDLDAWQAGLHDADVVVHRSRGGLDARLVHELVFAGVEVPDTTELASAAPGVRTRLGSREDVPLLVCVTSSYGDECHAELLRRLADDGGEWQLLLIGAHAPGHDDAHAEVVELASNDPRVVLAGDQPPEFLAGALEAADALLLPSRGETIPLCLLEAMSRGVPWIATPRSGAAIECAGGLVLGVDDFPVGIAALLDDPSAAARLGEAGRHHWERCFSVTAVARRYDSLLRGATRMANLTAPTEAEAVTDEVRAVVFDRLSNPPAPIVPDHQVMSMPSTVAATPYVPEYFDALQQGSLRSARTILPMVFELVAPSSVLDVGCGIGTWLAAACELGTEVVGIDGEYIDRARLLFDAAAFVSADLEQPLDLGRRFDLVTSLEVAEHLDPSAADAFVASLVRHGDVVLFSAAVPGQGGEHHVNEQWPAYWAHRFAAHGYVATDPLRARCWLDESVDAWYAQNVLVFVRDERLASFPALADAVPPGGVPLPLVHPRLYRETILRAVAGAPVTGSASAAVRAPLGVLAAETLMSPTRPDGLATALLEVVLAAAFAEDVEDNVDRIRFPDGLGTPAPQQIPGLLAQQLEAAVALEPLWDRLDAGSRQILVSLMAYKVLGWRKVRMPVGPFARLRRSADQIRDLMLREEATGRIAFLDWQLDLYDLGALGVPIKLHSHPWLIINEFMLEQYRAPEPHDVAVRPGDVVVDGGGCWAETSLHFAHLAGPAGRVETFEFDPSNLETLRRNLALNPKLAERVHVHPHPLWHTAGERLTYDSNGPGTRVGSGGAGPGVETASIDALVASGVVERIDFVKLDVEGAELSALRGAANTLRRFRPRLAIAAYHKPDDLLVLPAFLDELGVGYRFAIGHSTMAHEETILFAWCDDEA